MTEILHGVEVPDPYRWLEDGESPNTREWVVRQSDRATAVLHSLLGRDDIRRRLQALTHVDVFGLPVERNGRYFFLRRTAEEELPALCFVCAAEWLIESGITNPSRLAALGSSNGGLVVSAAITQRPELFAAAIRRHPLTDMIRYHRFLRGRDWVPEYGSPERPEEFTYLYAYSPYHRVRPGVAYPAVLLVTGDADTRVDPMHARKMAASLQHATASGKPVLFVSRSHAGHAGTRPVTDGIEELTDEFSFLFWQLGMHPPHQ